MVEDRSSSLDTLLWGSSTNATLHDAELLLIAIDYVTLRAEFCLNVCVGDPDAKTSLERERRRLGTMVATGLHQICIESPHAVGTSPSERRLLIDADFEHEGTSSTLASKETVNEASSDTSLRFWIYVFQWNSFIRVNCEKLWFEWK